METIATCKNCQSPINSKFCSQCGYDQQLQRIDGAYLLGELRSILNFDKGILFTIREMAMRPGESINTFISEDRNRLVKPIVFLILTSLVYTIAQQIFQFQDGYVVINDENTSAVKFISSWIASNYGYANVLMALFIAFWLKIMFRKQDKNYFEILILLCFIMGMGMLFFALFGIIESYVPHTILDKGFLLTTLYMAWAIGQFFSKKIKSYVKAFIAYMLGMFSFSLVAIMIGFAIDKLIT